MSNRQKKTSRPYRKITPSTVAMHKAQTVLSGSGTGAVRELNPEYKRPDVRAVRIKAKSSSITAGEYIENALEQIGSDAVERVGELVHSEDERIATKNAHYVIDHIRGKAVQRNVTLTGKLNIQSVLD